MGFSIIKKKLLIPDDFLGHYAQIAQNLGIFLKQLQQKFRAPFTIYKLISLSFYFHDI
jgi:hypothetical protein